MTHGTEQPGKGEHTPVRVLHAVVGHQLPTYFINAVRSIRYLAPEDDLLIVDNDSRMPELAAALKEIADSSPNSFLRLRSTNDMANSKVGGLYDAYAEILQFAVSGGYTYLHLVQADMQMLWWGPAALAKAEEIFGQVRECVNIATSAAPRGLEYAHGLVVREDGLIEVPSYGLTDTGLFHLGRWQENQMRFHGHEQEHARIYAERGHRVICHPWPPVCQLPWPAAVRKGRVVGAAVAPRHRFLLRPLSQAEIDEMLGRTRPTWLEDVCVPWGWISLTPSWTTALESVGPWVVIWRALRAHGWSGRPRWDRRGIAPSDSSKIEHRPSLVHLAFLPPWHALKQYLQRHRRRP